MFDLNQDNKKLFTIYEDSNIIKNDLVGLYKNSLVLLNSITKIIGEKVQKKKIDTFS